MVSETLILGILALYATVLIAPLWATQFFVYRRLGSLQGIAEDVQQNEEMVAELRQEHRDIIQTIRQLHGGGQTPIETSEDD